jgi:ribosomal protein L37E
VEPLERKEEEVRAYVLAQLPRRSKITHAEFIRSRSIYGDRFDIWDIWTTKGRFWVVTNPTNLYSQTDFVSMEVAFTYHVGLGLLLAHRNAPPENEDDLLRIAGPLRRWQEAGEDLNEAIEAEDFQAVGVRCREALLSMVAELADPSMVPRGAMPPKKGDFVHWAEIIADHVASGSSRAEIRSHLKSTATSTWGLAGWLTHAKSATRPGATIVHEAVSHTLSIFLSAVLGKDRQDHDIRCHVCGSSDVMPEWDPVAQAYTGRINYCDSCGFGQPEKPRGRTRTSGRRSIGA